MIWPWPRRRTAMAITKINGGGTPPGRGRGGRGGQNGGQGAGQITDASVITTTPQAFGQTAGAISWDSAVKNDGNVWQGAQPTRLTARQDGWYIVSASGAWASNANAHKRIQFRVNGTTTYPGSETYGSASAHVHKNSSTVILYLNKNDYVEVMFRESVAGTVNVDRANAGIARIASGSGCQVNLTSNEAISNAGTTAIGWDAEVRDDGGYWAAGNPTRLTVPSTGWYVITCNVVWASVSGDHWVLIQWRVNGTTTFLGHVQIDSSGVAWDYSCSVLVKLNATDYVEAMAQQTSGTNPQNISSGYAGIVKVG